VDSVDRSLNEVRRSPKSKLSPRLDQRTCASVVLYRVTADEPFGGSSHRENE
jgi:hypothetical protein